MNEWNLLFAFEMQIMHFPCFFPLKEAFYLSVLLSEDLGGACKRTGGGGGLLFLRLECKIYAMGVPFVKRSLEPVLRKAVSEFPAVALIGPRQSGKTTLLKRLFGGSFQYVSLDTLNARAQAQEDPLAFLAQYPPPVILDEVQHAPDLLFSIKERIDANRDRRGQYLLSGSQNLSVARTVSESLAGRIAMLRLLPLSRREADGRPGAPLAWEGEPSADVQPPFVFGERPPFVFGDLWESFLRGGYPEPATRSAQDHYRWHDSYMQTYLERDVRDLRQVGNLRQYRDFLRVLAARSSQLLNMSDIARDLGVAVNTVKAWLGVLEATYQVTVLSPFSINVGKRMVKSPKVYFSDVGVLCHLAGLTDPKHAASGPLGGAIIETAVLSEIVRTLTHRGVEPRVHFWRTRAGSEVDFVVDTPEGLVPIEVKLSATPNPRMGNAIRRFQRDMKGRATTGYVAHPGDVRGPLGPDVVALPFADL